MPQQWVSMGPVPMEGVKRTNAVMVNSQQRVGPPPRNPYTMDIDRSRRNCYTCGGFGHIAKHCKNRRMGVNRRMEVELDNDSNLNGEGSLMGPN